MTGPAYISLASSPGDTESGDCVSENPPLGRSDHLEIPAFVPAWEGLRGIAVLLTIISHVESHNVLFGYSTGRSGVAVFFVLSGFLITGVLCRSEDTYRRTSGPSYRHLARFYSDRMVRLYPALVLMVFTTGLLQLYLLSGKIPVGFWGNATLSLTYLSSFEWPGPHVKSIWGNTWSLAAEEQFYILWSLALPGLRRLSPRGRRLAIGALIFGSWTIKMLGLSGLQSQPGWLYAFYSSPASFFKMWIGALVRLSPLPAWMRRSRSAWIGLCILLLLQLSSLPDRPIDLTRLGLSKRYLGFTITLEPLTALSTILIVVGSMDGNSLLEMHWLRFIGRISYSFYLYQVPLLLIMGWPRGMPGWGYSCMAFVMAIISTLYVEEPLRDLWRRQRGGGHHRK